MKSDTPPWLRVDAADFDRYFADNQPTDLFESLRESVERHFMLTGAFLALGARTTSFQITLRAHESTKIEFKDQGIPAGAILLDLNCSSGGGPMPVLMNTSNSFQQRFSDIGYVHVYGASPPCSADQVGTTDVAITWIEPPVDSLPLRHLIDAVSLYSNAVAKGTMGSPTHGQFDRIVIPANIAAESSIGATLFEAVRAFANRERTENFLADGATYSHQLKVLLPIIAHVVNAPSLPSEIRGALDRLRIHRNKIAHLGEPKAPLTRSEAAEMIACAIFAYHYSRVLKSCIDIAKVDGRLPARQ